MKMDDALLSFEILLRFFAMKRMSAILVATILPALSFLASPALSDGPQDEAVSSSPVQWQPLDDKALGFAINLPGAPKFRENPNDIGVLKEWAVVDQSSHKIVRFMVAAYNEDTRAHYNQERMLKDSTTVLLNHLKTMFPKRQSWPEASDIELNGVKGKEILSTDPKHLQVRGVVLASPKAAFVLISTHLKPDPSFDSKLFNSLKIQ